MTQSCPNCGAHRPKYVSECPRCGLPLAMPPRAKLLFEVSRAPNQSSSTDLKTYSAYSANEALPSPSSKPLWVDYESPRARPDGALSTDASFVAPGNERRGLIEVSSFWPIVSVLLLESFLVYLMNVGVAISASELLLTPVEFLYAGSLQWFVYGLHIVCSWAAILAPIFLINQTPLMSAHRLHIPFRNRQEQILFSAIHLLSLVGLPLTYLFMLVDRDHRTPTEAWLGLPTLRS